MNQESTLNHPHRPPAIDVGFYLVFALTLLVPVFFVPSNVLPLQFSKVILAAALGALALVWFLYRSLRHGALAISWSLLSASIWLLPLAYLVAVPFSSEPTQSFLGYELPVDTFGFIVLAAVIAQVTALTLSKKSRVFSLFIALLIAAWGVFAFEIVSIVFRGTLPFFSGVSLVGGWGDLALFSGLIGAMILLTLESLPLPLRHHLLLSATFALALAFMMLVNVREVWILFAAAAFVPLVLGLSRRFLAPSDAPRGLWPGVLPAIGLVAALFFLMFGNGIAAALQQTLSVNTFDARPSFQATVDVLTDVYAADPVFGSGPNTFRAAWLRYRPGDIVQTPFWNVAFTAGSGVIVSSIATGGAVIALAWLLFVLALLYSVVRALFIESGDRQSYVVISLAALAALYLLFAHLLYTPGQSMTLLLFLAVGMFTASVSGTPLSRVFTLNLSGAPRVGRAFILAGIIITLASAGFLYVVGEKYASVYFHNQAVAIANQGDFDGASRALAAAIGLDPQDRYYRTAALVNLAGIDRIVRSGDTSDAAQSTFRGELASAVQHTAAALRQDPNSSANLMTRALVFGSVVPLKIDGAFENAAAVYEEARALNPLDPEIDLRLAQLYLLQGNQDGARTFITDALFKKADYTDAILLQAQIELDAGNLDKAIDSVTAAIFFEPQNPVLFYQLGILLLQDKEYTRAASSLEEAHRLNPEFANASFFLAQAYAFLNRFDEAVRLMEGLIETNPDNAPLKEYQDALSRENNPFDTAPTPPDEGDVEVIQ